MFSYYIIIIARFCLAQVTFIENTLETTGLLLQSASLLSDAPIVQHVNIATLEKMLENYTKLSEFLDKEKTTIMIIMTTNKKKGSDTNGY